MLTDEEIEQRTANLRGRSNKLLGEDEQRKTRNAVKVMRKILEASGHDEPEESDYAEYRRQSYAKDKSNGYQTTHQNISRIERFFAPTEEGSEQLSMIPEEELTADMKEPEAIKTVADDGANAEPIPPNEPESLPESEPVKGVRKPTKNKGGRKPIDENGEIRSEKLMLYLTPSMIADVRDWCRIKGISYANFIVGLIGDFMRDKKERLDFFRKFSNES